MAMRRVLAIVALLAASLPAKAQEKSITLSADPALEAAGLWDYALPRFKLKTGIRVQLADNPADVRISSGAGAPLFEDIASGTLYSVTLEQDGPYAIRFMDWLTSDIGQRTIAAFQVDDQPMFRPVAVGEVVEEAKLLGNATSGEALSLRKCGRCHVVGESNKYAGIGSTPSFAALRNLPDWRRRFSVFWTLAPHPSFTQIEGVTEPFDPAHPPAIFPIFLTPDEAADIGSYVETLETKDLGGPIRTN